MKRISKSIATQIACRPRHVVASGESSQVKSGRRRSRLAPPASRALLAVHLHSACSVYMHCFAVHLHSTLHHSPPELCLKCFSALPLCLQHICAQLCSTCPESSACSAPLISACSTSVPHSAPLATQGSDASLHALARYLSSLHHNHFSKSQSYIITNNPFYVAGLACFFHSVHALHTLLIPYCLHMGHRRQFSEHIA